MMNKNYPRNLFIAISSELCMFIVIMMVQFVDARLRENNAELMVSCNESTMNVRMSFKNPFQGIVFIPEHYYDPTCSYGVAPNSTVYEITLTLPHNSCKMQLANSGSKLIGLNTIVVFHHRMLETVYDYTQNVSCELKYPIKDLNKNIWNEPVLKSWISFENPSSILPEIFVEKIGLEDALLLVYNVKDKGVHRDMVVMNCIGHDASTVNEKTRFYQLSNPLGCSSDSDLVSNFTVFRNPVGPADMLAYGIVKNFSMVVRRRFYITCGAQICKTRCEHKCGEIDLPGSIYFSDIVTRGLVNRRQGSKRPVSLTAFERFDRQRRSQKDIELFPEDFINGLNESLLEKMNANSPHKDAQSGNVTTLDVSLITPLSSESEHIRSKRAVKQLKTERSPRLNVIVIKSDESIDLMRSAVNVQAVTKRDAEISLSKNSSDSYETDSVVKVKMIFESQHSSRIDEQDEAERFNFSSFLRALIAIFALICISGACYSLFSFRNQLNTVSVSDYVSQSYL